MFIIKQLKRHNLDLRVGQIQITNQVVYYIKNTANFLFYYRREIRVMGHKIYEYRLVGYADSNYIGNPKDKNFVIK